MRVRLLNLSTWPLADGASLVNLEQLAESTEKLAHEISPLVRENLEDSPKREKKLLTAAVAVTSAVWEGNGMHSTDLVNWFAITRTNLSLHGARVPENLEISKGPADPE